MKKSTGEFNSLFLFTFTFLVLSCFAGGAQPSTRLVHRLKGYLSSPYGYWEYLPQNYCEADKHPVVIYLHGIKETGAGESLEELDKVARNGVPHVIRKFERDFPFILIAPQSPGLEEGFSPETLIDLVRIIESNYKIDHDRIYLTGVSYGAYAALRLASVIPEKFAAIVPFSSCGGDNDLNNLKEVPMWAFGNAMDKREVPKCMERLVERLHDHGGTPLLTLYARKGHNAWERTYRNDFMWEWLLKQKKVRRNENQPPMLIHPGNKKVGIGSLALYTLMASDANNDSLRYFVESPIARGSHFTINRNGHAELMMNTLFSGVFNICVRVEDGRGGISRQSFWLRTNYILFLYPYFLIFILQPFIAIFPFSVLVLFLALIQLVTAKFLQLITHLFYWLSVLLLSTLGLQQ